MSQISKATFDTTYVNSAGTFADNTTRAVTESDLRQFADDVVDSAMFITDNFIDEDSFATDSATKAPSQQSTKAYVASQIAASNGILPEDGGEPSLRYKVLNIGDWNMISTNTVTIAHGLGAATSVRNVSVIIQDDTGNKTYHFPNDDVTSDVYGINEINNTNLILERNAGGFFATTDFNATSYNRGWVTIIFVP